MIFLIKLVCFLMLGYPTVWEYGDDKDGDFNKKQDVWIRIALGAVVTIINSLVYIFVFNAGPFYFLKPAIMCFAIFFLIFDYWIASKFSDNPFSYLSSQPGKHIDNIKLWRKIGPWGRFVLRVAVLIIALIIYF